MARPVPADSETRVDRRTRGVGDVVVSFIHYLRRAIFMWLDLPDRRHSARHVAADSDESGRIFVTVGFTLINTSTALLPNVAGLLLLKRSVTQSRSVSSCST